MDTVEKKTEDIAEAYIAFTGRNRATLSPEDYILFRKEAIKEGSFVFGQTDKIPVTNSNIQTQRTDVSETRPVHIQPKSIPSVSGLVSESNTVSTDISQDTLQRQTDMSEKIQKKNITGNQQNRQKNKNNSTLLRMLQSVQG
jgi:hypothetical protein